MNKLIFLVTLMVFIAGCQSNNYTADMDCDLGLFPSQADYDYCNNKQIQIYENCISSPDGQWNEELQKCEDKNAKIHEWFGDDGCIELNYVERAELVKGNNYTISVNNTIYFMDDFELREETNISETEYSKDYGIKLNQGFCQADITLQEFNIKYFYRYRLNLH